MKEINVVQDHIFTLHQSLSHNERILSHHHPAYLSQLRLADAQAKTGTDKAIMALTLISICAAVRFSRLNISFTV